ncbi:MAG: hypothetical protein AAF468_06560 [Pseudomonadota bacterium]
MNIPPMDAVECAVLHENFKPMDGEALFGLIRLLAAEQELPGDASLMLTSTDKDIHVMVGDFRIMVSQNAGPLGPEGFQQALAMPYTQMAFPEAEQAVANHTCNTFITFAKGAIDNRLVAESDLGEALGDALSDMNQITDPFTAESAMQICQNIALAIAENNPTSAVHWCANNQLMSPEMFLAVVKSDFKWPLYLNPYPFSGSSDENGTQSIGVVGMGSQWLFGKTLVFEEAPVPFSWLYEKMMQFAVGCQMRGEIIPHGDSFGTHEDEVIAVGHHEPSEEYPYGRISLTLVKSAEHDIDDNTKTQLPIHYDDEGNQLNTAGEALNTLVAERADDLAENPQTLDVQNPVDQEIVERLEHKNLEIKPDSEIEVQHAGEPTDRSEMPLPDAYEAQKKLNVAQLRKIAQKASQQSEKPTATKTKNTSSLVQKAMGLFARKAG